MPSKTGVMLYKKLPNHFKCFSICLINIYPHLLTVSYFSAFPILGYVLTYLCNQFTISTCSKHYFSGSNEVILIPYTKYGILCFFLAYLGES